MGRKVFSLHLEIKHNLEDNPETGYRCFFLILFKKGCDTVLPTPSFYVTIHTSLFLFPLQKLQTSSRSHMATWKDSCPSPQLSKPRGTEQVPGLWLREEALALLSTDPPLTTSQSSAHSFGQAWLGFSVIKCRERCERTYK